VGEEITATELDEEFVGNITTTLEAMATVPGVAG
jgi:hypothetical protein